MLWYGCGGWCGGGVFELGVVSRLVGVWLIIAGGSRWLCVLLWLAVVSRWVSIW